MRHATARYLALAPLLAVVALCSPARSSAAALLHFYVGAAAGRTDVRADQLAFGTPIGGAGIPLGFDQSSNGWRAMVGMRALALFGAELEYLDFGHPSAQAPFGYDRDFQANAHPRATTLSGLIYAPIPLPILSIYGKLGVSRLHNEVHAAVYCEASITHRVCPPTLPSPPFALDATTSNFAYGAGVQLKVSALAIRLEYERISASGGDPDMLSAGLLWTF